jgi:hypothetical protein
MTGRRRPVSGRQERKMSNTHGVPQSYASPGMFPRIALPDGALDGVRTRRMLAVCVDVTLVALIVATIWVIGTVATLGLALVRAGRAAAAFPDRRLLLQRVERLG